MILDYLPEINNFGEKLIRLYDFDSKQAMAFAKVLKKVVIEDLQVLDLSTLDFIEKKNCNLILRLSYEDEGIRTNNEETFYCDLTLDSFVKMLELIRPFCTKETRSHQHLYDIDTPIDFLFSPLGTWDMEF
ncbi:hypothetical protein [Arcticibacterium luteifluviistationis]|uniref:Uncharacterized protein n=1 Tax=Arcticibacterium luteifluviistationis TaxID=1784714 RepID=A0A2Z4G8X4_9BACT|nr:hypothetical protein [Arcticibacterium luteifluviistationis]AWV97383.1 hypothetical protein DJ013_04025 [Arcticibacterium luteifluviistationis]